MALQRKPVESEIDAADPSALDPFICSICGEEVAFAWTDPEGAPDPGVHCDHCHERLKALARAGVAL